MDRSYVIQKLLDKKKDARYLEIGVAKGWNFFPLRAKEKVAVDPKFRFKLIKKIKWMFKNPDNRSAKFCKMTSDEYFEKNQNAKPFDIIFIDGLHSYQQSLKDVQNSLDVLADDGVIVMHDCHPPNEASAHPANSVSHAASFNLPGWTGQWCGDVWKTVCHLRSTRKDLDFFVLDCDCGLGIITKSSNDVEEVALPDIKPEELMGMSYGDLSEKKEQLLNLKPEIYFNEFLQTV